MDDDRIIELYFARAEAAITSTQEKYGRLLADVIRRILPDGRDGEECANDVYMKLWGAIPPERPRSLGAYISRIARNLALDRYAYNTAGRRATALTEAFEELEEFLPDSRPDTEQAVEDAEFADFISRFLLKRSSEARVFFVRRYWYGESVREIASACRVSEEKVKSSLFRTRGSLRTAMEKENIAL